MHGMQMGWGWGGGGYTSSDEASSCCVFSRKFNLVLSSLFFSFFYFPVEPLTFPAFRSAVYAVCIRREPRSVIRLAIRLFFYDACVNDQEG